MDLPESFQYAKFGAMFHVRVPGANKFVQNQSFSSPVQVVGKMPCYLKVFPMGNTQDSAAGDGTAVAAYLAIHVREAWKPTWRFEDVSFRISLLLEPPLYLVSNTESITFGHQGVTDRGWKQFELHGNACRLPAAAVNGSLLFRVEVWGDSLGQEPACSLEHWGEPMKLAALWKSQRKYSDLIVKTDNGARHECHRAVLAASSSVFDRMLSGGFKEAHDANIHLSGYSDTVVEGVLHFIYTGELPLESLLAPGRFSAVQPRIKLSAKLDRESEHLLSFRVGRVLDVEEIVVHGDRVRGRVEKPMPGWVSIQNAVSHCGHHMFIVPHRREALVQLVELGHAYDMPSLVNYCAWVVWKDLEALPNHTIVRQMAQVLRKRCRTTDADEIRRAVKQKISEEPDLIDAFLDES
eukprot:TRINITY_DN4123_c0_g2_i1.p1 TRINITY_DN4123_c0_g2~~TRINITY_DN4123_c0_g2_i1.p1  ORF type:complete len:408 (+),score=43.91 TRINITY_DN4123_c0_g2_i1:113-1336(+)